MTIHHPILGVGEEDIKEANGERGTKDGGDGESLLKQARLGLYYKGGGRATGCQG